MYSGALDRSDVLLSYLVMTLASHIANTNTPLISALFTLINLHWTSMRTIRGSDGDYMYDERGFKVLVSEYVNMLVSCFLFSGLFLYYVVVTLHYY